MLRAVLNLVCVPIWDCHHPAWAVKIPPPNYLRICFRWSLKSKLPEQLYIVYISHPDLQNWLTEKDNVWIQHCSKEDEDVSKIIMNGYNSKDVLIIILEVPHKEMNKLSYNWLWRLFQKVRSNFLSDAESLFGNSTIKYFKSQNKWNFIYSHKYFLLKKSAALFYSDYL